MDGRQTVDQIEQRFRDVFTALPSFFDHSPITHPFDNECIATLCRQNATEVEASCLVAICQQVEDGLCGSSDKG